MVMGREIKVTAEMRRTVFMMAFKGHFQEDICLAIDMNKHTFDKKKTRDPLLAKAYSDGVHYYYEWVKLKRYENKLAKRPKIKGRHIGLIPFFNYKNTIDEILALPYYPPLTK